MNKQLPQNNSIRFALATMLSVLCMASSAFALSNTWTNSPLNSYFATTNNWNGWFVGPAAGAISNAVPGSLNGSGNTPSPESATFTNALVGGIGGASDPIRTDDSPSTGRARNVNSLIFDGINCGPYVITVSNTTVQNASNGVLWVSHNGSIRINGTVQNSQTILAPLWTILPSSTPGIYNLVNNATNPNVKLMVSSIMHAGATSRATTFILDGTNAAMNTVTNLSEGAGNATGGFTKQGSGTWVIAGTGTFPASSPLNVNAGTLVIQAADAFGVASTCNVNTNGTLRVDGVTPNTQTITLKNSGRLLANGSLTVNGVTVNTGTGNTPILATVGSSDVLTIGNAINKVTSGAADSILNVAGPGTIALPFDNNYVGKWSVNGGTLALSTAGGLGTGANVNIGSGAILDYSAVGASTFAPSTTGIGGSGTGTSIGTTAAALKADAGATIDCATGLKAINLTFTPTAFSGDTTHPALYVSQGTLQLGGNAFTINNASGTALGVGTYRIIQQASGSIIDGGGYSVTAVTGSGLASGNVGSIVVSGGNVNLVVAPYVPKNLVWTGGPANANWNVGIDTNWLNGLSYSVFNNSDNVTFNNVGSTNPTVNLPATLSPGTVTVDATSDYTFSGVGQIAGGASLLKKNTGTLVLNTVNTYGGGTVVSNGTILLGANNAVSGTGAGDVNVVGSGALNLNGFNATINGLNGNGSINVTNGGSSTLTLGNSDHNGTFSGSIQNDSGTLALTKIGLGTETLSGSNNYSGATTLSLGTLAVQNVNALGAGNSPVTLNAGTLDLSTNLNILSLAGSSGSVVANNSSASGTTNTLTILGASTTTFSGSIANGSGGGIMALTLLGGNLTMNSGNSYTGGTIVGSGATFNIANSPAGVTGAVIASNNATLGLTGGSGTPGTPTSITTVDGATVTFTAGALGKIWAGQFIGAANTTNRITTTMSFGGATSFNNFLGVVNLEAAANVRFINMPAGTFGGGDNTIFNFVGSQIVTRDAATVTLGEIRNGSSTSGIDSATTTGVIDTYIIGAKNTDSTFSGFFRGLNNLVKAGTGRLTFNGVGITTNTDNSTYTNYIHTPLVTHTLSTTISNGVLALVVPNNLSNSPSITLVSPSATLDASAMGYISNQLDISLTVTNTLLITDSTLEVFPGQLLRGIGAITGKLVADSGSTVSPGWTTGSLTVSSNITLNAVTMNVTLNRTNASNCGQLAASGASTIAVNGGTLNVTAAGNDLITGDVFHVFNKACIGNFTVTNLPASNALNTISYAWTNKLAIDGTLVLTQGASAVNTNPTNITYSVSGSTLTLSWPADHTGWTLQAQTNNLSTGLTTNGWADVPGSTGVNSVNVTIDPTKPTVFYRMKY